MKKLKFIPATCLLCLALSLTALADGDTPIANYGGDTPIANYGGDTPIANRTGSSSTSTSSSAVQKLIDNLMHLVSL